MKQASKKPTITQEIKKMVDMNNNPTSTSFSNFAYYRSNNPTLYEDNIIEFLKNEIDNYYGNTSHFSKILSTKERLVVSRINHFKPRTNANGYYTDGGMLIIKLEHISGSETNYKIEGYSSFCVDGELIVESNKIFLKL